MALSWPGDWRCSSCSGTGLTKPTAGSYPRHQTKEETAIKTHISIIHISFSARLWDCSILKSFVHWNWWRHSWSKHFALTLMHTLNKSKIVLRRAWIVSRRKGKHIPDTSQFPRENILKAHSLSTWYRHVGFLQQYILQPPMRRRDNLSATS